LEALYDGHVHAIAVGVLLAGISLSICSLPIKNENRANTNSDRSKAKVDLAPWVAQDVLVRSAIGVYAY
jgi:hypothetical protein